MAANPNPPRTRKRVDVDSSSLKRASNGSSFTRCDRCLKDIHVALIGMHDCNLDVHIQSKLVSADAHKDKPEDAPKAAERKPEKKRSSDDKAKRQTKKSKGNKDPNHPKRPTTAFFLFMEDFRKTYKEENPDSKGVAQVGKEGGVRWKSLTDQEKKPYLDKFVELKAEYAKAMQKYQAGDEEAKEEGEEAADADGDNQDEE